MSSMNFSICMVVSGTICGVTLMAHLRHDTSQPRRLADSTSWADEAATHLMFSGLSTNLWMRERASVADDRSENSAILFMNFT